MEDVAGLIWGYQSGSQVEVSAFAVSNVLRERIADLERSPSPVLAQVRYLVEALQLADEAIPDVAARFWYRRNTA